MSTITCPGCSAENVPNSSTWPYCGACGKRLVGKSRPGHNTGEPAEAPQWQVPTGLWLSLVLGTAINAFILFTGPLAQSAWPAKIGAALGIFVVCGLVSYALSALAPGGQANDNLQAP